MASAEELAEAPYLDKAIRHADRLNMLHILPKRLNSISDEELKEVLEDTSLRGENYARGSSELRPITSLEEVIRKLNQPTEITLEGKPPSRPYFKVGKPGLGRPPKHKDKPNG